ncbi:MAG: Acetyl-coenzyme A synthetase [Gemmatimonadaceae bacterium]|nr:Acetyl-coenzyme A synthetase [Gemmatimonadaceae bacterium]
MTITAERPLWTPSAERVSRTQILALARRLQAAGVVHSVDERGSLDYETLWRWSVAEPAAFWTEIWRSCGVISTPSVPAGDPWQDVVVGLDRMAPPDPELGPRWFAGARLNFAENLMRRSDDREAIVAWNEEGRYRTLTYGELYGQVARVASALRREGVGVGDRVAGYLPNIPEAVIAMLATVSLGAIWSSCSPDFGVRGVVDRFGQIEPKVLFAADGYRYADKEIDLRTRLHDIVEALPGIGRVVVVPYVRGGPSRGEEPDRSSGTEPIPRIGRWWGDWLHADSPPLAFTRLPFDHPVYILYSSGTTGLPKCMVHGAGGTLLQHLKEHRLHTDIAGGDRVFYFTTCGWMMWNWLVSVLASDATIVLYDGAPLVPGPRSRRRGSVAPDILWEMAEAERVNVFGTSAKYLALSEKEGLSPCRTHDIGALRTILSTGSPLAPSSFDYVYRDVSNDVCLSSISGGTDIVSCFALGNPAGAVWRGELQVRGLGMAVDVFDADGKPVWGVPGELVCTRPFPSMPIAFWNDPGGRAYRAAYFDRFPGAWQHGDWAEITTHGGLIITGRSDATLNPSGVRIGTAEIYRQVEQLPEIVESLVVGQDIATATDRDVRVVLFVRLRSGLTLDDAMRARIRARIRENASPHHVPKVIVQVADIPRTISGKITELAVREVIHGRPVANIDALANPDALALFANLPELSPRD